MPVELKYDRLYSEGFCTCPRGHTFSYQTTHLRKPRTVLTACPANIGTDSHPILCKELVNISVTPRKV